jgi:hypothetical protein
MLGGDTPLIITVKRKNLQFMNDLVIAGADGLMSLI